LLNGFYEFEKRDRAIYDGLREFCLVEKTNEEHLRAVLKEKKISRRPVGPQILLAIYIACIEYLEKIR
jgi:hypothetical protein